MAGMQYQQMKIQAVNPTHAGSMHSFIRFFKASFLLICENRLARVLCVRGK